MCTETEMKLCEHEAISCLDTEQVLISAPSGQGCALHAAAAPCQRLCSACVTLLPKKDKVSWLFQSLHGSDEGVLPTTVRW